MRFDKDYYRILELAPQADAAAIKKAYRRLAHQYHPDKNPGSLAEARFREIQEAYEVLGQQSLRAHYDEWRQLAGLSYRRQRQPPTAAWLVAQARQLAAQVTQLESYQIEQRILYQYLLFLLSEDHVALLAAPEAGKERDEFLEWLSLILPRQTTQYAREILEQALLICGQEGSCLLQLKKLQKKLEKEAQWRHLKPLMLMAGALLLCLLMYIWARWR